MANESQGSPSNTIDVSIGKEIDAALGDVIRGLLKRPSEAVGDLIADGIGILGDRVVRKRKLNAKLGMEEVRKRLDADGVEIKDIKPPKEEELYLLMNGLSLADDENVRDMWAGLFAKALEPDSNVEADRPYINVLESLSPMDAKIIDLLAFIIQTDADLRSHAKQFVPTDFGNMTDEEKVQAETVQKHNISLQKRAVSAIKTKAQQYGLAEIEDTGWADNLMRQGIVERTPVRQFQRLSNFSPTFRDERDIEEALGEFHKSLREMQEISERNAQPPDAFFAPHMWGGQLNPNIQLSGFGERFAKACGIL